MEYINLKGLPSEEAMRAYDEGYYVEAIQIMHGWIENQAQSFLTLVGSVHFNAEMKNTWDKTDTLSLNQILKVLFILNQITESEFDKFNKLNSVRNKIIHQLYKDPYDTEYMGVPKTEYDEVFQEMLDGMNFFTRKCESLV